MSDSSTVHGDTGYGPVIWRVREPEPFRRCSYCGSLHPEDFVAAAKAGARVDRSVDWKYGWPHKVYVHIPVADPTMLFCVSSKGAGQTGTVGINYVEPEDLTDEHRAIAIRDGMLREDDPRDRALAFAPRESHFGKFYNVHQCEPWVTEEMRQAIGYFTGYVVRPAEGGKIRWQAFDYANGARP